MIAVGETRSSAVALAVYLERACQIQLMAGEDVLIDSEDENLLKRSGRPKRPLMTWDYLGRVGSQSKRALS